MQRGRVAETEQDHVSGERGQGRSVRVVTATGLTSDSSLSCHSSMATACMASTSKANTQALIEFALMLVELSPAWAPRELGTSQLTE